MAGQDIMKAGQLRDRIELQKNTPVANSFGEFVDTWTTQATVWGAVRPLSGTLLFQAKQANSDISGEVEIRYMADIQATWRLKIGTRILRIVTIINPENRNEKLWIKYSEKLD